MSRCLVMVIAAMLYAACGSNAASEAAAGDTAADGRGEGLAETGSDVAFETAETAASETAGDGADIAADEAADGHGDGGTGPCRVKQGRLIPEGEAPAKFQLSVFHFNIQYVAGGLVGGRGREWAELHG
jgi:hypothetical protein